MFGAGGSDFLGEGRIWTADRKYFVVFPLCLAWSRGSCADLLVLFGVITCHVSRRVIPLVQLHSSLSEKRELEYRVFWT